MPNNPDEGSVKGKGSETMLPARGNPFQPGAPPPMPTGSAEAPASFSVDRAGTPDLSAEDLAKLFPDAPSPNLAAEVDPAFAAAMQPYANMPETAVAAPAEAHTSAPMAAAISAAPAAPAQALGEAAAAPGGAPGAGAEGTDSSDRQTGNNMFDPDIQWLGLEVNPEAIGPKSETFQRAEELPADQALVAMFVTDARLSQRWKEIDDLEAGLTTAPKISLKLAQIMLDRLATARNLLMNNRDQIEDAEREIAEVRYRFERIKRTKWFEEPSVVFLFLLLMLTLVVMGFVLPMLNVSGFNDLDARLNLLFGLSGVNEVRLIDLWNTIVWGGLGGVTGALYGLWTHVADKKDYDAEFSIWYYTNPLMGMMLGAFVYVVVQSGVLTFLQNSPLVLYILAWVIGFQQNLAFRLVNNLLKRLVPTDDKAGAAPIDTGGSTG